MKIFLTGGSGFIGKSFVKEAVKKITKYLRYPDKNKKDT